MAHHPLQVPHNINFREKKPKPSKKKVEGGSAEEGAGARGRVARFRYFEDIYGYSGVGRQAALGGPQGGADGASPHSACPQVFICGPSPHWLLVTGRGALRLHPMGIDGPIDSFAPFHNVNCPRGFLYFNRQVGRPQGPRCPLLPCLGQEEVLGTLGRLAGGQGQGQGGETGKVWRTGQSGVAAAVHEGTCLRGQVHSLLCPSGPV